jgi:hypothetical protein
MGYFSAAEANALAATTVRVATLVDLEFTGSPVYVWNGFGTRIFDGKSYFGAGDLGSIEGLEEARSPVSQQVTFTLSTVVDSPADLLALALADPDIVQGNLAVVSLQLFDADWQVQGTLIPIYFGIMQPVRVTREAATAESGARRTMVLPTENLWYGRSRPSNGRYTSREQGWRHPGDKFCDYVSQLVNLTINFPDYIWLFVLSSVVALANWPGQGVLH